MNQISQLYQDNIGTITPIMEQIIDDATKEYTKDEIIKAIMITSKKEQCKKEQCKKNWSYIKGILNRWKADRMQIELDYFRVTAAGRERYGEYEK